MNFPWWIRILHLSKLEGVGFGCGCCGGGDERLSYQTWSVIASFSCCLSSSIHAFNACCLLVGGTTVATTS